MPAHKGFADPSIILVAASVVGVSTIIVAFLGCMWCRNKWKNLTQRHYQLSESTRSASLGPVQNLTEFTIFPPPSSNQFSLPTGISPDEVVFEPLPEIRSRVLVSTVENIRPARFTGSCEKISLQDWFDEHQVNFPRQHLKYFREVGCTWYGQAVEGEALTSEQKTKVVVKILRVDATSTELMQYLQETRPFRDLRHPNLLTLLYRCLEVHPFLLIMEHCSMDLKTYLIEQRKTPEKLLKNGTLLHMACNITSAIQHMHEHGFLHMDIAAHNCVVTSNGVVKVGDYGTAVHLHRGDFYCLGDVAFPIRWCAPESLMCTHSIVEAKDITREANIWSFGVLLWELLEFGKLPYVNLSDNDVIQKVLIERILKLEQPKTPCVHKDMIYKIMLLCWLPANLRPPIQKISALLNYLYENKDVLAESSAFETRWNSMQPVLRDHNLPNTLPNVPLRFESDFLPDCDISADSKSPSISSVSISPSLLNLRGSIEDLLDAVPNGSTSEPLSLETVPAGIDSDDAHHSIGKQRNGSLSTSEPLSLETVPAGSDSDGKQRNGSLSTSEPLSLETVPAGSEASDSDAMQLRICEAIQDLDTILADEMTSSETSKCNTPDRHLRIAESINGAVENGLEVNGDDSLNGRYKNAGENNKHSLDSAFTEIDDNANIDSLN